MTSVGEILRRKREADGIRVEEIAGRLCITSSYMRAIEADDVQSLPGAFFYKSFTLQYARMLGLDTESLRADIDLVCGEKKPEPELEAAAPAESFVTVGQRSAPAIRLANRATSSRHGLGFGAGLALAVCAGIGFAVWQVPAVEAPVVTDTIQVPATLPETTIPESPEPSDLAEPAELVRPAESPQPAVLNLAAREATWLSITSDGREVFEGVLRPSQSKTLTGLDMARMRVGNAGGLDISWNGKPIGPIGETGQVRVVLFSVDEVQVLPPGRSL